MYLEGRVLKARFWKRLNTKMSESLESCENNKSVVVLVCVKTLVVLSLPIRQSKYSSYFLQRYSQVVFFQSVAATFFSTAYTIKNKAKDLIVAAMFCSHQLKQCVSISLIRMKACCPSLQLLACGLSPCRFQRSHCRESLFKNTFFCLQWLLGGKMNRLPKENGIYSHLHELLRRIGCSVQL